MLNKSFSAKLQKKPQGAGWTYVLWPEIQSNFLVRVGFG